MLKIIFSIFALVSIFNNGIAQTDSAKGKLLSRLFYSARDRAELKDYNGAILAVDSAMALDSTNDQYYALKAEFLWMKGDFYQAAVNYEKALKLDDDSSYLKGSWLFLGVLYEKAGQKDLAHRNYSNAIDLLENHPSSYDKAFWYANGLNYTVALILSGKKNGWVGLMADQQFVRFRHLYREMTREQVLEKYWKPFGGG